MTIRLASRTVGPELADGWEFFTTKARRTRNVVELPLLTLRSSRIAAREETGSALQKRYGQVLVRKSLPAAADNRFRSFLTPVTVLFFTSPRRPSIRSPFCRNMLTSLTWVRLR